MYPVIFSVLYFLKKVHQCVSHLYLTANWPAKLFFFSTLFTTPTNDSGVTLVLTLLSASRASRSFCSLSSVCSSSYKATESGRDAEPDATGPSPQSWRVCYEIILDVETLVNSHHFLITGWGRHAEPDATWPSPSRVKCHWNRPDEIIENRILKSRELRANIPRPVGASGCMGPFTSPWKHPLLDARICVFTSSTATISGPFISIIMRAPSKEINSKKYALSDRIVLHLQHIGCMFACCAVRFPPAKRSQILVHFSYVQAHTCRMWSDVHLRVFKFVRTLDDKPSAGGPPWMT